MLWAMSYVIAGHKKKLDAHLQISDWTSVLMDDRQILDQFAQYHLHLQETTEGQFKQLCPLL